MKISVSGKGVDVGSALKSHIEEQIEEHVKKYIDRVTSVHVVISREAHLFRVDITGNIGTHSGLVIRGRGALEDIYAAFDEALEKISKQLRRYKRKITNHHKNATEHDELNKRGIGTKYIISADSGEQDEKQSGIVIAEKPTDIEKLTVSEAVMRMDLQDLPALMFYNSAHGRLNIIYRRTDGNISWVDPSEEKAA
ncbi:MAG: ribosome-associated translation inhibitor RaiA [Rickettsiales bacterium]